MPAPRQYLSLMSVDNSLNSTTREADSAASSLDLLSTLRPSSCIIKHSLAAGCFNRIWGENRARTGVRLSGSKRYLSYGKSSGAVRLRSDGRLTWMTEWRQVTAGCPPRLRCWGSCGRCHHYCPRGAREHPP